LADFSVETEEWESDSRVHVAGELDLVGAWEVDKALAEIEGRCPKRVVIDLRAVSFVDSSGLSVVARAASRAATRECRVVVVRPRGMAQRTFEISGVARRLEMVDELPRWLGAPRADDG
jgi:anti-sigma B factor antagonist